MKENESSRSLTPFDCMAADRLAAAVDLEIAAGRIDARSAVGDARLEYGSPFPREVADEIIRGTAATVRRREEEIDARDLVDSGLLFELNRRVLHPLGLALAIEVDPRYDSHRISRVLRRTEDPEGFEFDADSMSDGYRRLGRFLRDGGYSRLAARYERLGFRAQTPPPIDPFADEADWIPPRPGLAAAARELLEAADEVVNDAELDLKDFPFEISRSTFERLARAIEKVEASE